MINPVRQEILRQLERLSELAPDMRFGQLIANLSFIAAGPWDETLWELDDERLLAAIQQHVADLSGRSNPGTVTATWPADSTASTDADV